MASLDTIFAGGFRAPPAALPRHIGTPEAQLMDAMTACGIAAPDSIYIDGRVHRFKNGGRGADKSGWYIAYGDGIPAGRFGCWRSGIEQTWRAESDREFSPAEEMELARRMAEAAAARDAERKKAQAVAADTVATIWEGCEAASSDHPYLVKKGVAPHGARVTGDGRLALPLYDDDGELKSLQYVAGDGSKLYHSGGKTGGCYWLVGSAPVDGQTLYIAEGFATAATVNEVTGSACLVAYSASNLPTVAKFWRDRMGALADIVVVADNDASGTGQKYAAICEKQSATRTIMPPVVGDVNDYSSSGGDVGALFGGGAVVSGDPWLIPADDFCQQPAPIRWLVKGWLQQESLIMIHGPSGGGKTFVLLEWLLTIASGAMDWHGRRVAPGAVVYLAGEGHAGLRGRVAGWKQARAVKAVQMWISRAGCDLNTPAGYQQAVSEIARLGIKPCVIAVDTLHRFLAGDENSAQDAKTMLDACSMLMREFGCAVVLVHHTGVSEEAQHRARGSSAWRGALEIEISVKPATDTAPMEIIQRKAKDAEMAAPIFASLNSTVIDGWFDEDGDEVTTAVIELESAPVKMNKQQSKINENMEIIKRAWFNSGAEKIDGLPYISKSALVEFLVGNMGKKQSTAETYIKPCNEDRLVGFLIKNNILSQSAHGFTVTDGTYASAMNLAAMS